ncbi:hypothetical protein QL285_037377 [Trifolium repens]|nr:hypothetical protein QL285_037377 [Trifolium repens]
MHCFGQILVILDFGPLVIGENVNAWNDYWIVQGIIISNMNIKIPRVDGNNLYLFMGVKIGEFSVAAAYDILQGYEPNNFGGWLCVW